MIHKKQAGLSLIEIMIALALSAVLILGLTQIFAATRQANRLQDGMARVQESARVGMEILGRDIRNGAYLGCASWASFHNNVDLTKYTAGVPDLSDSDQAIQGYNDITAIDTTSDLADYGLTIGTATGNLISGTDALVLRGAESCAGGEVTKYNNSASTFFIDDATSCGVNKDDIVLVTNCQYADMFAVTNVTTGGSDDDNLTHGASLNNTSKLNGTYGDTDAEIMNFYSKVYYIGMGQDGRPSLYLRQLEGKVFQSHELVEGIDDLQLLMGEDSNSDGSVDRYLEPGNASLDNSRIVSVKVTLSLSSEENITIDRNQLNQSLESLFAVRNRL